MIIIWIICYLSTKIAEMTISTMISMNWKKQKYLNNSKKAVKHKAENRRVRNCEKITFSTRTPCHFISKSSQKSRNSFNRCCDNVMWYERYLDSFCFQLWFKSINIELLICWHYISVILCALSTVHTRSNFYIQTIKMSTKLMTNFSMPNCSISSSSSQANK